MTEPGSSTSGVSSFPVTTITTTTTTCPIAGSGEPLPRDGVRSWRRSHEPADEEGFP
jgi:hypothetical protein